MNKETRTIVYDEELQIEAYSLNGFIRPFPNHFHEYYVFGLIEGGKRLLSCKNKEYQLQKNDIVVFNPGDNHSCRPMGNESLDYRGINIPKETMIKLTQEITGKSNLPFFSTNVIYDEEIANLLRSLHQLMITESHEFEKEEIFFFLISQLLQKYGMTLEKELTNCSVEIEKVCAYMEENFAKRISLDELCNHIGMSKSTLLRAFTKFKGVTPYCYLENMRISRAKKLLEQGVALSEVAPLTGFSDQSHFTNYFSRFIGISPKTYREIFQLKENEKHGTC